MNIWLIVSLGLNGVFLLLGWIFVAKRGGFSYVMQRLFGIKPMNPESYCSPYYRHRQSQFEQFSIAPMDVVFVGDSLTDEGEWSEWFAHLPIKNRGIGGDTTIGLLARIEAILAGQPRLIVLMIGINDLLNEGKSAAEISQNYRQILTLIKAQSPNSTVLLQSILPTSDRLQGQKVDQEIMAINTQLQALAQQFSYQYIDLFSHFADQRHQLDSQYTTDGVHLNGRGYQRWQDILRSHSDVLRNAD